MTIHARKHEVEALLRAEHADPFRLLGPHRVTEGGHARLAVRVLAPLARKAELLADGRALPMERVHPGGLFERVFEGGEGFPYRVRLTFADGSVEERADPYAFPPVLTDFDLHLLGEGSHLNAYEKLGAHPVEVEDVRGVLFAVWAPNAARVSVVGDFNGWDGRRHPMRSRGGSGIWELFVPELGPGTVYKYELRSRQGPLPFLKADPFGFFHEVPPKTASVVWDIGGYEWGDRAWMDRRASRNPLAGAVNVYEVHLGSWMRVPEDGGRPMTYRELADRLIPYAKDLGFTHLEFMPVTEHPYDASWGYQTVGYFAPTSRFGTPQDFKHLVDRCHRAGLGVLLDWVPSHFPTDSHGLAQFDGTALYEHADPRKGFQPDWNTLIFNLGRNEVSNFLLTNALFWLREYHVDGLRVDAVASMLYLDYSRKPGEWVPNVYGGNENLEAVEFLKRFNTVVHRECPGVLTVAEESTAWPGVSRPVHLGGLGFSLKWNMGWMHDSLRYISKEPVHRKFHHGDITFSMLYHYHENFTLVLSHDEVVHGKRSLLSKMPGDDWQKFANLRAYLGYMAGHPGKKLLFMGGEFGQHDEWSHARSLDWHLLEHASHQGLQNCLRDLNRLVLAEPALHEFDHEHAGFEWVDCDDAASSVLAFYRFGRNRERPVLCLFNFTPVIREGYRVGVPAEGFYAEILNTDAELYGGSNKGNAGGVPSEPQPWQGQPHSLVLTLPPLAALFLQLKK